MANKDFWSAGASHAREYRLALLARQARSDRRETTPAPHPEGGDLKRDVVL